MLNEFGGIEGIAKGLRTDSRSGLDLKVASDIPVPCPPPREHQVCRARELVFGLNRLPEEKGIGGLALILAGLREPIILIFLLAATGSALLEAFSSGWAGLGYRAAQLYPPLILAVAIGAWFQYKSAQQTALWMQTVSISFPRRFRP